MKLLLITLLLPLISFSQEMDENGNYILKGTTVLFWSEACQITYYQYGYYLSKITSSDCDQSEGIEEITDEVVSAGDSKLVLRSKLTGKQHEYIRSN